jgi:23S rRNA (uracil1939-C5)-methyltransferase
MVMAAGIGQEIDLEVEEIAAGGAGLARHRGQAVFIRGAAPGERVSARVTREHRGWAEAELLGLVRASPHRVKPRCPLCGSPGETRPDGFPGAAVPPGEALPGCGGCPLQYLDYRFQLEVKAGILREAFRRLARFPPGAPSPAHEAWKEPRIVPSPAWEYRNRVQLHRAAGAGGPALGFKSAGGGGVAPLRDCPVADPGIRSLLASGGLKAPAGRDRFTVYSRDGLVLSEGGRSRGRVRIRGRELLMDAGIFFQSNAAMLEVLAGDLESLARRAGPGGPLADLYCGVGTFAGLLAGLFSRIDLLEENKAALALARENVGAGGNFFAMTDNEWVKTPAARRGYYSLIIADPPRQGLSPALRRWLSRGPGSLLAYVSCDPATLARDSGELAAGAWEPEELRFYDFYPQTAHIESLAVFRNRYA